MHIVIAPNAFKGSLSASLAAASIARGLEESELSCRLSLFPVADGGDGTVPLLVKGLQGEMISCRVHDSLNRPMTSAFGWIPKDHTALIALSDASGLKSLHPGELRPLEATTFGSGELILAALKLGARKLLIGVGGTATVDGGTGIAQALGVVFYDNNGEAIHALPSGLSALNAIRTEKLDQRMSGCETIVLCDVENKLLGSEGAARVFGPQKGADASTVPLLEHCLENLDSVTFRETGIRMSSLVSGGAAGGAAAGLAAFLGARLVSGIDFFLDCFGFDDLVDSADLTITGEGRIDGQTKGGKGPFGVALRAKARKVPVIGMAGSVVEGSGTEAYFDELIAINGPGQTLQEAMQSTESNLYRAAMLLGNRLAKRGA